METSTFRPGSEGGLGRQTGAPDGAARVCEIVARIEHARDPAEAVSLLKEATARLGADAAVFVSFIRDDATWASHRTLENCDPRWSAEYASHGWFVDDPWLQYAMTSTEPVRAAELVLKAQRHREFTESAARHGFRSAVIVPAPTSAGRSRVGMLCLGSATSDHFEGEGYAQLRVLARALAMELNHWWQKRIRADLIARTRITDDDLALLCYERMGHTSKAIAAALNTEPKTIDCRFQRVNLKLCMPNRRASMRLAELYGLI